MMNSLNLDHDKEGIGAGLRVLVVDDDLGVQTLLARTFAGDDWDVLVASNGLEALELVQTSDPIDAVVLDLQMPVMDGRTFYGELQQVSPGSAVMIVSAHGAAQAKQELGADAAVSKPFDPFLLAEQLRRLVPVAH